MKKSLLIILSLIFMNMTAHAVGVDCWEEYSTNFDTEPVSKVKTILPDEQIIRVNTSIRGMISDLGDSNLSLFRTGVSSAPQYCNGSNCHTLYFSNGITMSSSDGPFLGKMYGTTGYQRRYLLAKDDVNDRFSFMSGYYAHTFCLISDHSSSGGGGGAAGASVNYIIKAN